MPNARKLVQPQADEIRYEFEQRLGPGGGDGEVWTAYDSALQERVAIKRIHKWVTLKAEGLDGIRAEVLAGRRVVSRHVLKLYDLVQIGRQHCLVMEYVNGVTLSKFLQSRECSSVVRKKLARQLCLGLMAIHEAGFTHRDLRPDNIMVDESGRLVVIDLGWARIHDDQPRSVSCSYQAPELSRPPSATLADVYSLGAVLALIAGGSGRRPSEEWLFTIASKCMLHSAEKRYRTVREVLKDLERIRFSAAIRLPKISRFGIVLTCLATAGLLLIGFFLWQGRTEGNPNEFSYVVTSSGDAESQTLADVVGVFLESRKLKVSVTTREAVVDDGAWTNLLPKRYVVDVTSGTRTSGMTLQLRSIRGDKRSRVLFVRKNSLITLLSVLARNLGIREPDLYFDFATDGYSLTQFSAMWRAAESGDEGAPNPHVCQSAKSVLVQLVRANLNLKLLVSGVTETARRCAVSSVRELEASNLSGSRSALLRAGLLRAEGNPADAVGELQAAVETLKTKGPIYNALSEDAFSGGFIPEAVRLAKRSVQEDPFAGQSYLSLSKAYVAGGQNEDALRALLAAISIKSNWEPAYTRLGGLYVRMGRFSEAKSALEKAVELNATPQSKVALGLANMLCGNAKAGVLILSGAVAQKPSLYSLSTLGAALRWTGETMLAEQKLNDALKFGNENSTDPVDLGRLAMVNAQLFRIPKADELLSRASKYRSAPRTEILYYSLVVDAFADRRNECKRKFHMLLERHFPTVLILSDPKLAKTLRES